MFHDLSFDEVMGTPIRNLRFLSACEIAIAQVFSCLNAGLLTATGSSGVVDLVQFHAFEQEL
jgi:hypothetical protein